MICSECAWTHDHFHAARGAGAQANCGPFEPHPIQRDRCAYCGQRADHSNHEHAVPWLESTDDGHRIVGRGEDDVDYPGAPKGVDPTRAP